MKKFLLLLLVVAGIYHFQGSNISNALDEGFQNVVAEQSESLGPSGSDTEVPYW